MILIQLARAFPHIPPKTEKPLNNQGLRRRVAYAVPEPSVKRFFNYLFDLGQCLSARLCYYSHMAAKQSRKFSETGYINRIADWFCERGWHVIDQNLQGVFTRKIIASNDGTMIAKISGPDNSVWTDGDCSDTYPLFAQWAATQNNPHLPKIYQARSLARYDLFLTIMERLEHLDYSKIEESVRYDDVDSLPEERQAKTAGYIRLALEYQNLGILAGQKFRSLVDCIVRMADRFGALPNDLHSGNMMLRGNTLVLSDPYSWVRKLNEPVRERTYMLSDDYSDCKCSLCNPKTVTLSYVRGVATMREQRIQALADMLLGRKQRKA